MFYRYFIGLGIFFLCGYACASHAAQENSSWASIDFSKSNSTKQAAVVLSEKNNESVTSGKYYSAQPVKKSDLHKSDTVITKVGLGLIAVTALFLFLAWGAKRVGIHQLGHHNDMNIISTMSLGGREKAVLVNVDGQKILLGVSPGRINTLHNFPTTAKPSEDHKFSDTLGSKKNLDEKFSNKEVDSHASADFPETDNVEKENFGAVFSKHSNVDKKTYQRASVVIDLSDYLKKILSGKR